MSIFYKTSNNDESQNLYEKKLIYESDILESEYDNLVNFQIAEKFMYGRVNFSYNPIVYDADNVPLSTLSNTNTEQTDLQAACYVANAFNDLAQKFRTKILSGEIDSNQEFLSNLEVKKAYQDPVRLYKQYLLELQQEIINTIKSSDTKFDDYNKFKVSFYEIIKKISNERPITFPGFMKSRFCPINVSGLVIEIADIDYDNDLEKIIEFKNSRNWKFYLNTCRSYGFLVDSSNPFRLIANIGSPEMLEYAENTPNCRLSSTVEILSTSYSLARNNYESVFRQFALETYNLASSFYLNIERCKDGTVLTNIVEPKKYTSDEAAVLITDSEFIAIYMDLRFNEENTSYKQYQKNIIIRNTKNKLKNKNLQVALRYFAKFIASTYNRSGSLTDLINRATLYNKERTDSLDGASSVSTSADNSTVGSASTGTSTSGY